MDINKIAKLEDRCHWVIIKASAKRIDEIILYQRKCLPNDMLFREISIDNICSFCGKEIKVVE